MRLYLLTYRHNHDGDGEGPSWSYAFRDRRLLETMRRRIIRDSLLTWFDVDPDEYEDELDEAYSDFNCWAQDQEYIEESTVDLVVCKRKVDALSLPGH